MMSVLSKPKFHLFSTMFCFILVYCSDLFFPLGTFSVPPRMLFDLYLESGTALCLKFIALLLQLLGCITYFSQSLFSFISIYFYIYTFQIPLVHIFWMASFLCSSQKGCHNKPRQPPVLVYHYYFLSQVLPTRRANFYFLFPQ